MIFRSRNYIELEAMNKEQLEAVSNATHEPHRIVERCSYLLYDFVERYLSTKESRDKLISDVDIFPEIVDATLNSIIDHLDEAKKMLGECQGITETIEK